MFEIGDIVRFRNWTNQPWQEGTWVIIDSDYFEVYDDKFYRYIIRNQETGENKMDICSIQIETI